MCNIDGVLAHSVGSDEQMTFNLEYLNLLPEQLQNYRVDWYCFDENLSEIDNCLEVDSTKSFAQMVGVNRFKKGQQLAIAVDISHLRHGKVSDEPNCWTNVQFVEPDIEILPTGFFTVGTGETYFEGESDYVTPFDHIFLYCQHETPELENMKIYYNWTWIEAGREQETPTYKSHQSFSRAALSEFSHGDQITVRCEVKGNDRNEKMRYYGMTQKTLKVNMFDQGDIRFQIQPTEGVAWETDFEVIAMSNYEEPFDCKFYYQRDNIRFEMIPQGLTPMQFEK